MRRHSVLLCLAITAFTITSWSQINQGLLGYYPFRSNANDESGNGHHGIVYGATLTTDRLGTPNSAYSFNRDTIALPSGWLNVTTTTERTISLWAKADSVSVAPNNGGLISQYLHGQASTSSFFIGLDQTGGAFRINVAGNGVDRLDAPLGANPTGQWLHIVVVLKAGANYTLVYVNDSLRQQGTVTYNPTAGTRTPWVGDINGGANNDAFFGAIDDIRMYNRVLSTAEIDTLFTEGRGGLLAWYPFTGNANDSSGNGHHGTVHGATLTADRFGTLNSAYSFNRDTITLPAGWLNMTTTTEKTISLWAKPDSVPLAPNNGGLISQYLHGQALASSFFVGLDQTGGVFRINVAGNGVDRLDAPLGANPTGQWLHIAMVLRPGTNSTLVFVNSSLIRAGTATYNTTASTRQPWIGDIDGGSNDDSFRGVIDDIRVYDRALSAAEIALLYGGSTVNVNPKQENTAPRGLTLSQNYPNPFNPSTTISFQLPQRGDVQVSIYNSLGQLVRTLVNEQRETGTYSIVWDGRDDAGAVVSSGAYFYQVRSGDYAQAKKMLLLK